VCVFVCICVCLARPVCGGQGDFCVFARVCGQGAGGYNLALMEFRVCLRRYVYV